MHLHARRVIQIRYGALEVLQFADANRFFLVNVKEMMKNRNTWPVSVHGRRGMRIRAFFCKCLFGRQKNNHMSTRYLCLLRGEGSPFALHDLLGTRVLAVRQHQLLGQFIERSRRRNGGC